MKNNKALGQHWLNNRAILDEIAELALKDEVDLCIEIGPGLGYLTSSLLKRFNEVIAVEFDQRLANNLPKSFPGKNLKVVNGDILKYDFDSIKKSYVLVGNIPYYITSPIIEKALTVKNLPRRIVLLVQKEVAERITDNKETVLSLFVKNRAKVWTGPVVKKDEFTPPPKVDSQVIVMEPYEKPLVDEKVFSLIQQGFKSPRKKLIHNLLEISSKETITKAVDELDIKNGARPGDLSIKDWENLYKKLA